MPLAGLPVTKWVLYLSALNETEIPSKDDHYEGKIDLNRIQEELKKQDGQEVEIAKIREILIKLSRGDLLEYFQMGNWFGKVKDPILLEFLKVWGQIEVIGKNRNLVLEELRQTDSPLKRRIHDHLGYLAEIYLTQVLWNSQSKNIPGKYVHQKEEKDVSVPSFIYIHQRKRLKSGQNREIDVVAAGGKEKWLCESKWWRGKKVGKKEVEYLLENGKLLKEEEQKEKLQLVFWFFAHDGFTQEAETFMQKHDVLWSTRSDLDQLLAFVGLRLLPDL